MSIAIPESQRLPNTRSQNRLSWAIVGGGPLGMTIAHRLVGQGEKVTLIESAPSFGGLTAAWNIGQAKWDRFYHVILLSDIHLRALLTDLDLEKEIKWVTTRTGFYSGGKLHSMSSSWEFLKFPPLTLWEKFRLGCTILYGSRVKNWQKLEQIPVEKWLRKLSGNSTFEKIWLPLLKSKLGDTYKRASASFIWAYIDRMYAARRTGMKREMFGYVPGGYGRILDGFSGMLSSHGAELLTGHHVRQINRNPVNQKLQIDFSNQQSREFDRVIVTTPAPVVSNICPELTHQEKTLFDNVEYMGVICASMLLKKQLGGYYVTNITDPGIPLTGVIEMSAIVDTTELQGNHLVYLPKYVPSNDDQSFSESDAGIKEKFLSAIEKMYPGFNRNDVVAFQVAKARNVMALPTIGFSKQLPPMVTSVPGLYVISSAHIVKGNLNVNETIQIADEGLQNVMENHANISHHVR
jgi:protoporphyrinogen oxidase